MRRYELSRKAESDFIEIWNYTFDTWGESQADRYTSDLKRTCNELANNPQIARSVAEIKSGYLKYRVGKHYLYFRETESGIEIIRREI